MFRFNPILVLALFSLAPMFFGIGISSAQETPEGLLNQEAASTGTTEVIKDGFQNASQIDPNEKDETNLEIQAGGMLAGGNSESMAVTAATKFLLRRENNQFSTAVAANYALSEPISEDPSVNTDELDWEPTVENIQGNLRYDRFLANDFSIFLSVSGRYDRFQGLDLRLNLDPGVAYYFLQTERHRFWGELGYDFQYDIRRQEIIDAAAIADPPEDIDKTEARHHARLFLGYDNKINRAVVLYIGFEYLQGIPETKNYRFNGDLALNSSIAESFSVATTFSFKYDHNPLPNVDDLDILLAANIIYTIY